MIKDSLNRSADVNVVVPRTIKSPSIITEPVVRNDPVKSCVSSNVFPNFVEPLSYKTEELTN